MEPETIDPQITEVQAERDSSMLAIGMPERARAPDLCRIFPRLYRSWRETHEDAAESADISLARIFAEFDDILVRAGL